MQCSGDDGTFTLSKLEAKALLAFASKDSTQYHINRVHFSPSKGEITATDGHTLTRVSNGGKHTSSDYCVYADDFTSVVKAMGAKDTLTVGPVTDGKVALQWGNARSDRTVSDVDFPATDSVIPQGIPDAPCAVIGLNAKYIARLELITSACGVDGVTMTAAPDALSPVRFTCSGNDAGWLAVIMPMRV